MFQFDSDFYKQCHADRVTDLRIAYEESRRFRRALAGQPMQRRVRQSWWRLRCAATRHRPAFRS